MQCHMRAQGIQLFDAKDLVQILTGSHLVGVTKASMVG